MHPLDTVDRKQMLQEEQGLGLCNITKCCTEVCPEHIKITDNGIIPMKERVVDVKFDPWGKVMRTRREAEQPRTPAAQLRAGSAGTADGAVTAAPSRTVLRAAAATPVKTAKAAAATPSTPTRPFRPGVPPARAVTSHDLADADRAVASRTAYMHTLTSLHGVAELLLAGPQRRANRSIRLTVTDDGFATGALGRPPWRLAVRGTDFVAGTDERVVVPLQGTFANLAANAGVSCLPPADAYPPASGCKGSDFLHVDQTAAAELLRALKIGDTACRAMAAAHAPANPPEPVLWPEHFDVSITLDEVNYGVSPGDDSIPEAYAYVGPHTARKGKFWNQPFGAARPITEFADAGAVVAFFEEGRRLTTPKTPAT
jgi:hypothetical protein